MKKIIKFKGSYSRAETQVALSYCPTISPCQKCGYPVVSGYCCGYCKDSSPYEK